MIIMYVNINDKKNKKKVIPPKKAEQIGVEDLVPSEDDNSGVSIGFSK